MGLFGSGISLKERAYDESKDEYLEHIGTFRGYGSSEHKARNDLEEKARTTGAKVVFGVTCHQNGLHSYSIIGEAYKKIPKAKKETTQDKK